MFRKVALRRRVGLTRRLSATLRNIPFLPSCDAIEFAEMGQGWRVFLDLPVKLLMVFHASRLECVKSMVLTTANQFISDEAIQFPVSFAEVHRLCGALGTEVTSLAA